MSSGARADRTSASTYLQRTNQTKTKGKEKHNKRKKAKPKQTKDHRKGKSRRHIGRRAEDGDDLGIAGCHVLRRGFRDDSRFPPGDQGRLRKRDKLEFLRARMAGRAPSRVQGLRFGIYHNNRGLRQSSRDRVGDASQKIADNNELFRRVVGAR